MTSTITRTLPPSQPSKLLHLLPTPHPTTSPTTLTLTQHDSTFSSDTYTLATASGETLYTTTSEPNNKKWTSHRTFLDAGGQPVFSLRCANGRPLRWTVALPGREDYEDEALATLQWSHHMGQERVEVLLGEARKLVGRKEKGLGGEEREGRRASSKDVAVFDGEDVVVQTRIVGNGLKARVPFRDNEWEVSVAEDVDAALVSFLHSYFRPLSRSRSGL